MQKYEKYLEPCANFLHTRIGNSLYSCNEHIRPSAIIIPFRDASSPGRCPGLPSPADLKACIHWQRVSLWQHRLIDAACGSRADGWGVRACAVALTVGLIFCTLFDHSEKCEEGLLTPDCGLRPCQGLIALRA